MRSAPDWFPGPLSGRIPEILCMKLYSLKPKWWISKMDSIGHVLAYPWPLIGFAGVACNGLNNIGLYTMTWWNGISWNWVKWDWIRIARRLITPYQTNNVRTCHFNLSEMKSSRRMHITNIWSNQKTPTALWHIWPKIL